MAIEFTISEEDAQRLRELMEAHGCKTYHELINLALDELSWYVEQREMGNTILIIDFPWFQDNRRPLGEGNAFPDRNLPRR
jgi:hypothetical protein